MTDVSKITVSHLRRVAVVYVRQSTPGQVVANTESTAANATCASGRCRWGGHAPRCG